MTPPPVWASRLVERICTDASVEPPTLTWRRSKSGHWSSGFTFADQPRIVVTAGKDSRDRRFVLLHELAHWLAGPGEHHGPRFWEQAFDLYAAHGLTRYATRRESDFAGAVKESARRRKRVAS